MIISAVSETNYLPVITVLNDWWGGRQMADMLPKLFFKHFKNTSFIAEEEGQIRGFLIGFVSQTYPDQAYIHFAGTHPAYRGTGIGKTLYAKFIGTVKEKGCNSVHLVTSPVNQNSIAYHTRIGFAMEKGDVFKDNVWIHTAYDGPNEDRVVFFKNI